jgi:hypothetical protein
MSFHLFGLIGDAERLDQAGSSLNEMFAGFGVIVFFHFSLAPARPLRFAHLTI